MSSRKRRPDETYEEYRKALYKEKGGEWFKKKGVLLHVSKTFDEKVRRMRGRTYERGKNK